MLIGFLRGVDEALSKGQEAAGTEEHERGDEEKEDKGTNDGGVVDDKVSTDEKEKLRKSSRKNSR